MKYLIIPALSLALLFSGCSTTTAVKTEGVTVTTVDTGMKTWSLYVQSHLTDGKVTQKEINDVQTGYQAYYNAQLVSESLLENAVSTGSTNDIAATEETVTETETSLLALINQYLNQ